MSSVLNCLWLLYMCVCSHTNAETLSWSKDRHASSQSTVIYEKYNWIFFEAFSGLFQSEGKRIMSKEKTLKAKALFSAEGWIFSSLWRNMNSSEAVVSEPWYVSCDCALSRGTLWRYLGVSANCWWRARESEAREANERRRVSVWEFIEQLAKLPQAQSPN